MINYYLIAIVVALVTFPSYIPFINLLYKLKLQKDEEKGRLGIIGDRLSKFQKLHAHKRGTPIGGGILVIIVTIVALVSFLRYFDSSYLSSVRVQLLLFSIILFGLFGFYDDLRKIIPNKNAEKMHLSAKVQMVLQILMGFSISLIGVKNGLISINIPGYIDITHPYLIVLISTLAIVYMVNAINITDGLDGLGAGAFFISALTLFSIVSFMPEKLFLSILMGALIAYLYYNIYPARMFNGDTGTFAIGAALTLILLMNNLFILIPFFGFLYIADALTSLLQGLSKRYRKKSIFEIAPIHHHFEMIGWHETKVTLRFLLVHIFFSFLGLALYLEFFI